MNRPKFILQRAIAEYHRVQWKTNYRGRIVIVTDCIAVHYHYDLTRSKYRIKIANSEYKQTVIIVSDC